MNKSNLVQWTLFFAYFLLSKQKKVSYQREPRYNYQRKKPFVQIKIALNNKQKISEVAKFGIEVEMGCTFYS
ncbi:hypothetical protein [Avibacterium paragallinarum]|uniref:hypothetical protein n=1 Tax=Avibacterium paragallinarum TaxID=728 RepID=UPI00397BAA7E